MGEQFRQENWSTIAEELDKVGINIDAEVIEEILQGQQEPIDRVFTRIERYMKIIAGADFLKFDDLKPEDFEDADEPEPLLRQVTDADISDLIDLRQNTVNMSMSQDRGGGGAGFMPPGISGPGGDESMDLDAEVLDSPSRRSPKRSPTLLSPKRSPTMREEPEIRPFADDKKVKDGVDILKLN